MNSANKGFSWERKLAKILSLWVSDGADKDILWRQGGSGGRATIMRKKGVILDNKGGDIVSYKNTPETELFSSVFYVEAKCIRGGDLFPNSKFYKQITKYLCKAKEETKDSGKVILLVIKQDYKEPYVLFTKYIKDIEPDIIFPKLGVFGVSLKEFVKSNFNSVVKHLML